jgi:PTS system nitrogen regulatory IIA component
MFPANFINIERTRSQLDITSKKRVLEQLGELLASGAPGLDTDTVFEHLLERERLGSTGLGHGIALPHARAAQVDHAVGAFLQLREGVDFDAMDDQPVDLAFGLLVPQNATEEHLQLLAGLASMFSDPALCTQLRAADSAEQLLQHIQAWEELRKDSV